MIQPDGRAVTGKKVRTLDGFEGYDPRECGEHRTVGPHRAWCFDCGEWCYPEPDLACKGCRIPMLEAKIAQASA